MATIKKACKGALYPKSSSVSKRIGSPSKAKTGGSFKDLSGDGKITKKDVLIGRGVLPKTAKKGMKVKKAQTGTSEESSFEPLKYRYPGKKSTDISKTADRNYRSKSIINEAGESVGLKQRRTVKGFLLGKPKVDEAKNKNWSINKSKPEGGKMTKQGAWYKKGGTIKKKCC